MIIIAKACEQSFPRTFSLLHPQVRLSLLTDRFIRMGFVKFQVSGYH
jgi:hypothetical protein